MPRGYDIAVLTQPILAILFHHALHFTRLDYLGDSYHVMVTPFVMSVTFSLEPRFLYSDHFPYETGYPTVFVWLVYNFWNLIYTLFLQIFSVLNFKGDFKTDVPKL